MLNNKVTFNLNDEADKDFFNTLFAEFNHNGNSMLLGWLDTLNAFVKAKAEGKLNLNNIEMNIMWGNTTNNLIIINDKKSKRYTIRFCSKQNESITAVGTTRLTYSQMNNIRLQKAVTPFDCWFAGAHDATHECSFLIKGLGSNPDKVEVEVYND